jgi:hypothetical protein
MKALLCAALLAVSTLGCGSSEPSGIGGKYTLNMVNGTSVPGNLSVTSSARILVQSGQISLGSNGTYTGKIEYVRYNISGGSETFGDAYTQNLVGTFTIDGENVEFTDTYGYVDVTYPGTLVGSTLTVTIASADYEFVK